jgi:signal recognition particle subunit SRP68
MVKVEIIATIKSAQSQNGLKHSDYQRYRRYCSKKLRHLRKSLKFFFGHGKFEKKEITTELCDDNRYILLLLFNAERSWSYAMQLRQHISSNPSSIGKRHLLTRLRKAVKWSERLESIVNSVGDVKSTLEAQAYKAVMQGNLDLECQQWEAARDSFLNAQAVYCKLENVVDSIEAVAIQQKLAHIQPMIKYCLHQIGNEISTEELLELKFSNSPEAQLLNSQIESLLAEARQQRLQSAGQITVKGKTYNIKNEKARIALQKAEEVFMAMERASDKLEFYTEAFGYYDEACRYIKKEKEDRNAAGDLGEASVWNNLLESIQELKNNRIVERNLELVKIAEQKFEDETEIVFKGFKPKGKPAEIVKVYDVVLNSIKNDEDVQKKAFLRGKRAFYMSLVYLYNEKWLESYAMLQRCLELSYTNEKIPTLMVQLQAIITINDQPPDLGSIHLYEKHSEFPPGLQAISTKPIFYDLALDYIEYPDLSSKIKGKGMFQSIKGWFGRS